MAQPAKKPKRTPLGPPVAWSDSDLDDLSTITPADLKAAEALWQRDAPAKYKSLLKAQAMENKK